MIKPVQVYCQPTTSDLSPVYPKLITCNCLWKSKCGPTTNRKMMGGTQTNFIADRLAEWGSHFLGHTIGIMWPIYIGHRSENTTPALWVILSFSRFQNAQMNPLSTLEHQTKTLKNNHRNHLEYFPNLVLPRYGPLKNLEKCQLFSKFLTYRENLCWFEIPFRSHYR